MPSKESEATVVKNVEFKDVAKKKKAKSDLEELNEDLEEDLEEVLDDDEEDDDDEDEDEDEDEDDEDDEDEADGLTDIGLYNVLGNFMVDDDGNTIGVSLSNIAKELSKLNHLLKKYVSKS